MSPSDAALLRAYAGTRWTVSLRDRSAVVRIGTPVSDPALPRPAGIVTAYNPRSLELESETNEQANRQLAAELRRVGAGYHGCVGEEADAAGEPWREPSFYVFGLADSTVVAFGARYEQNAVVLIDDAGLPRLVASRSGFCGREPGEPLTLD
jgi:hypothetical protein